MPKRFNNLNAALRYLRPVGQSGDGVVPDAPANTPLRRFQEWKAGKIDLDYVRDAASRPGQINSVSIKPFALPSASTLEYAVPISARAEGQYALFGLSTTILGIEAPDNDDIRVRGFIPAKAVCKNITGTTATAKDSKLTGISYKTKPGVGYTFPIGRTATNAVYAEQKAAIIAAVEGAAGNKSVSFIPEKY